MMNAMRKGLVLLLALLCLMGVACAEETGLITPNVEELIVPVGESVLARYSITPDKLKKSGVTFESSDTSIATVGAKGYVRGRSEGRCTVTLTSKKDPSVSAELPVWVVTPVKNVKASLPQKILYVGDRVQMDYSISPDNASIKDVTFTSRNKKVCIVNQQGMVTAVGAGKAEIVVRSADGNAQRTVEVTVRQLPRKVTFKKEEYYVNAGKSIKFLATVLPKTASNKKLTWSSSDETIARVDSNGKVTTKLPGDVIITATCVGNPEASGSVVVHSVNPVKSISFEQTVYDTGVGGVIELHPIILPEDASHPALKYEVRNRQVCRVDENGVITTLHGGITNVVVSSTDGSNKKAEVTVRSIVPVEGVEIKQDSLRVEVGNHDFAYAVLKPIDATLKDMTWVSSDPSIASVSGEDNRARIYGHKWGSCVITGTTEQGGYSASIKVNVGALRSPVVVEKLSTSKGVSSVILRNDSDMHITRVTLSCKGSGTEEQAVLDVDLAPGAVTEPMPVETEGGIRISQVAVRAWETDTGYYNDAGELRYAYRISPGLQVWKGNK